MAKSSDADAVAGIRSYMLKQNRPYSAIDILNNMHKQFGKTQVIKSLDILVEAGEMKEKLLSKQKIYYPNQDQFPLHDDAKLAEMDEQIKVESAKLKTTHDQHKIIDAKVRALKSSLTTAQLRDKQQSLHKELEQLSAKLCAVQSGSLVVTKEDKHRVDKEYDTAVKTYRKRKAIANDILNAVLENYPKKKKDLYEEIGIETDEDMQFKI